MGLRVHSDLINKPADYTERWWYLNEDENIVYVSTLKDSDSNPETWYGGGFQYDVHLVARKGSTVFMNLENAREMYEFQVIFSSKMEVGYEW